MRRGSPRAGSAEKPSGWRASDSGWAGNGPSTGALARPRRTSEKKQRDRLLRLAVTHPLWTLGFAEEGWWSRLAQPRLHSWAPVGSELRWGQKARVKAAPDPKARPCYGLGVRSTAPIPQQVWLRFATGPPVGAITTQSLAWGSDRLAALGQQGLLLSWDNASWHTSQAVRGWLRAPNRAAKHTGNGVRILACRLPSRSPWLNPLDPKWLHGNRAVLEPQQVLTATALESRVYAD